MTTRYRTTGELEAFLTQLDAAPKDAGTLDLIVCRPGPGEREVLDEGRLDPDVGLVGDSWLERTLADNPDDAADTATQLTVMSTRMVGFLAVEPARRSLAGDQLYLDLDLSQDSLPVGSLIVIGDPDVRGASIEVTSHPHTGCAQFVQRFGADAMRFVNGRTGRPRRLRGLNARVVRGGLVRPGDPVRVIRPS